MRKLITLVIAVALFASCEDNDELDNLSDNKINYIPLEIGNYWVYQQVMIDTSGYETVYTSTDSIIITGDTLINNKKYFIHECLTHIGESESYSKRLLRDSLGYLVYSNGRIVFSDNNLTDTLYKEIQLGGLGDTIYTSFYKMENPLISVTVPAGTFEVLNLKGTFYTYRNQNEFIDIDTIYTNAYYANNIGKVVETYGWLFGPPVVIEKRLIRYNIQ